ncbi:phosphonoacetaldehyde hydrolase [Sphingomonas sp. NFR15]|uniref:phosphonoacetaldehyde hydrolase n=1 Tax=Sphingomonas sp. NFR15 TaxID=1566282 RepID=UPI00087FD417|nr:phosphonoacetaldehyde hydrolase [Sphingomonas sp. NFR15]SDA31583.1 phosphonoacetaldehyde hydrolase [Sphingomonas sp. NFR15]
MSLAIKAVIFDWAGTMIDFGSRAPVIALLRLFEDVGVPITEAEARADMGRAKRDHIRAILAVPHIAAGWRAVYDAPPGEADVSRLHDAVEPIMRAAAADCAALVPGAAQIAARLRGEGVRIGSCTGYTRAMMADILPRAADQGYAPEVVVCSGETAEGRPSPLMAWKALVELGVWPSSACVKVDDATVGVREGREAGMWTVGLAASGNGVGLDTAELAALPADARARRIVDAADALYAAGADYVIDSVVDLWPVLEQISVRVAAGEKPA